MNASAQDLLSTITSKRRPLFDEQDWTNYIHGMLTMYVLTRVEYSASYHCMCAEMEIRADQNMENELKSIYERAMIEFKIDDLQKQFKIEQYCAVIKALEYDEYPFTRYQYQ